MTATRYHFADFMAAYGPAAGTATGAPAPHRTAAPIGPAGPLATGARAALLNSTAWPDMAAAARAGMVDLAEIGAAAPYIPPGMDYPTWRDTVLFPFAAAVAHAPQHAAELRLIFDQVNRRTADPAKAQSRGDEYFTSALVLLDKAVDAYRTRGQQQQTIGHTRILHTAVENGWDGRTDAHRQAGVAPAAANGNAQPAATVMTGTGKLAAAFGASAMPTAFFSRVKSDAASLHAVRWLVRGVLIRGATTVIAGQGASAKTALAVKLAVTLASGRQHFGPFLVDTRPGGLRVAFMSAEEDPNRIGLLVAAACGVLRLTAAERAAVDVNLVFHDAGASGWRLGEPGAGTREDIAPEERDHRLAELVGALAQHKPDVLILDTFAALFALPSEIDNSAITKLMSRLTRAAGGADCAALALHHTPKMTREAAAAQRGESTLVRGGSAIVNSARVVLTLTSLPAAEAGQAAMQGLRPDRVRRLEHVKINDMPPMDAAPSVPCVDGPLDAREKMRSLTGGSIAIMCPAC